MSSKEIWMSLFHQTLDKYVTEELPFRSVEMLVHVLMLEVEKIKECFAGLNNKNKEYAKQIEEYKQKLSESITFPSQTQYDTPPQIMFNDTLITPEGICRKEKRGVSRGSLGNTESNLSSQDLFSEGSDVDLNLPNNNEGIIIDESPQNMKVSKRLSVCTGKTKFNNAAVKRKKVKSDFISNENIHPLKEHDILYATPVIKRETKSKKFKQSKLSLHGIFPISDKEKLKDDSALFKLPNFDESTCVNETPTSPMRNCTITSNISSRSTKGEKSASDDSFSDTKSENDMSMGDSTHFSFKSINDDMTCIPDEKLKALIKASDANNPNLVLNDLTNNIVHEEKKFKFNSSREDSKEVPAYAYKNDPVRKRSERQNLDGWDCDECEKYYANIKYLSDEELQKRKNMCSKHRSNFNPRVLTPQGFWDPDFSPTQDSIAFFN